MLEQTSPQLILFFMLYGGAAVLSAVLCLYLLLSRGNAIAPGTTPPARLRRWAGAFFGVAALGHLWWYLFIVLSGDIGSWAYVACVVLDCVSLLATIFGTMLAMLQDRRRPLWPFLVAMTPIVIFGGLQTAGLGIDFMIFTLGYTLAIFVFFCIYMTVAIRQYGRWLRDNYADLEHKEVWQSHTLLLFFLMLLTIYGGTDNGPSLQLRIADFVLFGLLLWRVETLPQLEAATQDTDTASEDTETDPLNADTALQDTEAALQDTEADVQDAETAATEMQAPEEEHSPTLATRKGGSSDNLSSIGDLLKEKCENTGLYLQHDMSLVQLSAVIGINRSYLSLYFSKQGMNYNTYINGLRINHFIRLYRKVIANQLDYTAQQLAQESGYRSYSTFSLAFKQRMGQSVSAWMHDAAQNVEQDMAQKKVTVS
ncbi:MAG: helix-turn-helix transcriptional regulator [Prevotella sp.]|nr:helix-turn-helix transcriptional regulator [Prevotella sp.]